MDSPATVFVARWIYRASAGRAVPFAEHDAVLRSGTGWVPANLALSAFGTIAPTVRSGLRATCVSCPMPRR
jgi:glutamine synthetase